MTFLGQIDLLVSGVWSVGKVIEAHICGEDILAEF
jgi:hypothetical protein